MKFLAMFWTSWIDSPAPFPIWKITDGKVEGRYQQFFVSIVEANNYEAAKSHVYALFGDCSQFSINEIPSNIIDNIDEIELWSGYRFRTLDTEMKTKERKRRLLERQGYLANT